MRHAGLLQIRAWIHADVGYQAPARWVSVSIEGFPYLRAPPRGPSGLPRRPAAASPGSRVLDLNPRLAPTGLIGAIAPLADDACRKMIPKSELPSLPLKTASPSIKNWLTRSRWADLADQSAAGRASLDSQDQA